MQKFKKLPGLVVILSSPSGTGKTSICHRLIKKHSDYKFSVSATTRPLRGNEKNGFDYHFVTNDGFDRMLKNDELAEWANVFDHRYGTPNSEIKSALSNDKVLLCDIDVQGGSLIKQKFNDSVGIFIIPPSLTELKNRLFKRKTDSAKQKKLRLDTALVELKSWRDYDYIVLNDDLKVASNEVDMIISAERAKTARLKNSRFWSRTERNLLGL